LPLKIARIPAHCTNEEYEHQMRALIDDAKVQGVVAMAFGDLYLGEVRAYRERLLASSGIEPVFPLWQRPTSLLAREMIESGIKATLTCIDPAKLDRTFAGRPFDLALLADLPQAVDPCGENGEFHTFVHDSPDFHAAIDTRVGETVERDGFVFADVLPTEAACEAHGSCGDRASWLRAQDERSQPVVPTSDGGDLECRPM
jgi:diphthamide synthase (EF-2-diphthine--ammonia ligase)